MRLDARRANVAVRASYKIVGGGIPTKAQRTPFLKGKRSKSLSTGAVTSDGKAIYSVKVVLTTRGGAKRSTKVAISALPDC